MNLYAYVAEAGVPFGTAANLDLQRSELSIICPHVLGGKLMGGTSHTDLSALSRRIFASVKLCGTI